MTARERPGPPRREWLLVALGALALAVTHLGVAAAFGALGVARNDDWVYYRVAFASASQGGFAPDPFTNAMLVGLVALARPVMSVFGPSMAPLQVLVSLLGAMGLWAAWWVARHFLARRLALLAMGTLALGPFWGALSVSFMTDVPAFAAQSLGLALTVKALRAPRVRWWWLGSAVAACLVGFTIREYAAAGLLAVLGSALVVTGGASRSQARRQRLLTLLMAAAALAAAAALYRWRGGLVSDPQPRTLTFVPGPTEIQTISRTLYTLGLLLAPALLVACTRGLGGVVRRHPLVTGAVFLALGAGAVRAEGDVLLGNLLTTQGPYAATLTGDAPAVVPTPVWTTLTAVAVLGATLLIVAAGHGVRRLQTNWRRGRRSDATGRDAALVVSALFGVIAVALVIGVAALFQQHPFDRYLLPVLPFAAALVLATGGPRRRPRIIAAVVAVGVLALAATSTVFVLSADALDGAKWHAGERSVAAGLAPETVDAGLEWFGMHQPGAVVVRPNGAPGYSFWVSNLFVDPRVCAVASWAPADSPAADPAWVVPPVRVSVPLGPTYDVVVRRADLRCAR